MKYILMSVQALKERDFSSTFLSVNGQQLIKKCLIDLLTCDLSEAEAFYVRSYDLFPKIRCSLRDASASAKSISVLAVLGQYIPVPQ